MLTESSMASRHLGRLDHVRRRGELDRAGLCMKEFEGL